MIIKAGEKVKEIRLKEGLSQAEFGKKLGVGQTQIANIENNTRGLSTNMMMKLELVFGTGVLSLLKNDNELVEENCIPIPFYEVSAAAGEGIQLNDAPNSQNSINFDRRWLTSILGVNPNNLFLIYAKGNSMDTGFKEVKDIKDGDLLMVDSSVLSGNNKVFVIMVNNSELRVKRLFQKLDGTLVIISDNPSYPEEIYRPDDNKELEIKVIGKVVWNGSKENI